MNCPFCNSILPESSSFCGYCGKKLADYQEPIAEVAQNSAESVTDAAAQSAAQPVDATVAADEVSADTAATENTLSDTFAPSDKAAVAPDADLTAKSDAAAEQPSAALNSADTAANSINLGKDDAASSAADNAQTGNKKSQKSASEFKKIGETLRSDAQQATAAVKSRNFKELFKSKVFYICCTALVVILIILIGVVASLGSDSSAYDVKGYYYAADDGDSIVYLYNGKIVKNTDFTSYASVLDRTPDGTAIVVEDDEALYLINEGKVSRICNDFDSDSASISANGKTVAYITDDCVYVYTGGKSKKIASLETSSSTPVISPDGKTVAFCDVDDDDINTYVWKGGKVIDLDSDIDPFSVSNGGKYIYGTSRSGYLYYIKGLKKNSEEKIDSFSYLVGIDYDHTKLLYVSSDGTYCFDPSVDDEDAIRIVKRSVYPIASSYYHNSTPYIENFKSFYGKSNGAVYEYFRKGKSYDDEKILSDVESILLSDDQKSFVYIDGDGDLMKGTMSNAKNEKKVAKNVASIRANDTLKNVYYCDEDSNLRYVGKDGKIASDIRRYYVTDSGVCVFYDTDGDLYYSVKGGEKKKAGLDEISSLVISNDIVYVVSDDELYISTNGKTFNKTGLEID